jgi:molybdopterin molybdotransferase
VPAALPGAHIRRQGSVFRMGTAQLKIGQRLGGAELAVAAAAGYGDLLVRRRPRVAILSSGDELAAPGALADRWQIYDSNSYGIAALANGWGAEAHRLATTRDDVDAISVAAARGLAECDFLVLVGGASAGDHDVARPALVRLGLEMTCSSVAMRPGKPIWFGITQQGPVLGLPGNPVAAFVCAHLFLKPLISKMLGHSGAVPLLAARLSHSLPANGEREHYALADLTIDRDGTLTVRIFERQESSLVSACALANVLVRRLPRAHSLDGGAIVDVVPLRPLI